MNKDTNFRLYIVRCVRIREHEGLLQIYQRNNNNNYGGRKLSDLTVL